MKTSLLALFGLALTAVVATGCSKPEQKEKTQSDLASDCQGKIDYSMGQTTAEEIIDGKDGIFKLNELRVYVESRGENKLSYFAAKSQIDLAADPGATPTPAPSPTATPAVAANEAAQPAETSTEAEPAKPTDPTQIEANNFVLCSDMKDLADSSLSSTAEAPIAISRKDGLIPQELAFKLKSEFLQQGEKSEAVEKSSSKTTTEKTTQTTSPLLEELPKTATRTFYKFGYKNKGFAIRTVEKNETATRITIAKYVLFQKKKKK